MKGSAYTWAFLLPAIVLWCTALYLACHAKTVAKIAAGMQVDARVRSKLTKRRCLQINLFVRVSLMYKRFKESICKSLYEGGRWWGKAASMSCTSSHLNPIRVSDLFIHPHRQSAWQASSVRSKDDRTVTHFANLIARKQYCVCVCASARLHGFSI